MYITLLQNGGQDFSPPARNLEAFCPPTVDYSFPKHGIIPDVTNLHLSEGGDEVHSVNVLGSGG